MLVCAALVCWQAFFQTELVPMRVSRIVFGVEQDENSTVSQISHRVNVHFQSGVQ